MADQPKADDGIGPSEVARILGITRQTVYTIPWLRERAFRPTGKRGMKWERRVVDLYKAIQTGRAA